MPTQILDGLEVEISDEYWSMINMLRAFMRDFQPLNRLLAGEESSDRQLALAIFRALEDFSGTPPPNYYTLHTLIQHHHTDLLLRGAACKLLESVVFQYARNEIQFTDAGVNVKISDKTPIFLNIYGILYNQWTQEKKQAKVSMNIMDIVTTTAEGVFSEYWLINSVMNQGVV